MRHPASFVQHLLLFKISLYLRLPLRRASSTAGLFYLLCRRRVEAQTQEGEVWILRNSNPRTWTRRFQRYNCWNLQGFGPKSSACKSDPRCRYSRHLLTGGRLDRTGLATSYSSEIFSPSFHEGLELAVFGV